MGNLKKVLLAVGVLVLILTLVGAGWYLATKGAETPTSPSNPATQPSTEQPSEQQAPKSYDVKVYFSKHPESDDGPGATFPVHRTTDNLGVATFAVSELLKGPTSAEANRGYFTTARLRAAASTCGRKDFRLVIKDGVATLTFCKPFDHVGSVSDGHAESAIKATLGQFNSIKKIILLNSRGSCEFDLSGQNLCLQ